MHGIYLLESVGHKNLQLLELLRFFAILSPSGNNELALCALKLFDDVETCVHGLVVEAKVLLFGNRRPKNVENRVDGGSFT